MTDTPRTDVEALAETYPPEMQQWLRDQVADVRASYPEAVGVIEAEVRQQSEAQVAELQAAIKAWADYWDARTELWDAVGKCGHDPLADCPEMDALRAQGTDDKFDRRLRQALANSEPKP